MKKPNTTTAVTETTTTENILTYSANPFCEFDKKTNLQQEHTQEEFDRQNPYGDTYWKKKDYFKKCPCP